MRLVCRQFSLNYPLRWPNHSFDVMFSPSRKVSLMALIQYVLGIETQNAYNSGSYNVV